MSAEPALIDTNVLVYALFAQRPEHAASLALLESAQEPAPNLVVAPQNLAEFYAVVTNPRRVSTPLSGAAARAEVEKFTLLAGLRILRRSLGRCRAVAGTPGSLSSHWTRILRRSARCCDARARRPAHLHLRPEGLRTLQGA